MGACSSCLGFGRRDRGVEVPHALLATTAALTRLPCVLRTWKHLVSYTTILTARNTEQRARLSIEGIITNLIQNHFDERPKLSRGSVTTCLSMCNAVIRSPTLADMQLSDVLDVFTALPQSGQANGNFTSPPTTAADEGTPMASRNDAHTTKKQEPTPQGMMYRSVRTAPSAGHIWKDLNEDPKTLEVAKAVMEGSSERP